MWRYWYGDGITAMQRWYVEMSMLCLKGIFRWRRWNDTPNSIFQLEVMMILILIIMIMILTMMTMIDNDKESQHMVWDWFSPFPVCSETENLFYELTSFSLRDNIQLYSFFILFSIFVGYSSEPMAALKCCKSLVRDKTQTKSYFCWGQSLDLNHTFFIVLSVICYLLFSLFLLIVNHAYMYALFIIHMLFAIIATC